MYIRELPAYDTDEFFIRDLYRAIQNWVRREIDTKQLTAYPSALRCNPSLKYLPKFASSCSAASQILFQTSTKATPSSLATCSTACAYRLVTLNSRSSCKGGSRPARSAALSMSKVGGGLIRRMRVSCVLSGDADFARDIICLRFEMNFGRGTCWGEGGMQASFAPNQMVRMRILWAVGLCVMSCKTINHQPNYKFC